ncbi:MAG: DUF998 domain-containing protein [Promethearchaeota archaeon]|nr:MAG: DUF998 domain-containing protein [Candidatus Lokiarchaeota archaeon]
MEFIDKIYTKINASYFAFIGLIIFFIGLIPAILVHPSFSFFETHISHLGGPTNALYIFFNVFWFITAIFIILFMLGFTLYLQEKGLTKKGTWIMFILAFLSAIGIMGMAIFNTEEAYTNHFIFELVFFFTGILYLFGYAVLENKAKIFSKWQILFNIIVAAFFILYLILLVLNRVSPGLAPEFQSFAEWLFLFANLFWFFENGVLMLRKK